MSTNRTNARPHGGENRCAGDAAGHCSHVAPAGVLTSRPDRIRPILGAG